MNKRIKILMISLTAKVGGGPSHMFLLGSILSKNFDIFYGLPKSKYYSKNFNNNKYLNISERKILFVDILKILKFIRNEKIDILHAHGKGAGVLLRIIRLFSKKPLIYTFHGIHLNFDNLFLRLFYLTYENIFGFLDTFKIFVSESERQYAKDKKIFFGKNNIVINNGVKNKKIKNFKNNQFNEKNNSYLNSNKIKVISVSRLVKQKNIFELIKIAELLPDISFNVIGDGPLLKEILAFLSKRKIKNIRFLGYKSNLFYYLKSSSIFLSTSLYEGLPNTIIEAMSFGLPVVASDVVGNCDTFEHNKSGYFYPLGDINCASIYLKKLAYDFKLREQFGKAGFERQRDVFSLKKMETKYTDFYFNIKNNKFGI